MIFSLLVIEMVEATKTETTEASNRPITEMAVNEGAEEEVVEASTGD